MKINLAGNSYNTVSPKSLKELKNDLSQLLKKKDEHLTEIKAFKKQIENAEYVTETEIELYKMVKPAVEALFFAQTYIEQEVKNDSIYTFIDQKFYLLPECDDQSDIPYVLITKYLYERKRHEQEDEPCASLRAVIEKFIPNASGKADIYLEKILTKKQTEKGTYFGDELSENSDSEAEKEFQKKTIIQKNRIKATAGKLINRASEQRYESAIARKDAEAPPSNFKQRLPIPRDSDFNDIRRQVKDDLEAINDQLKKKHQLPADFLENLETKFVVAQYRGIHYFTSSWSAHIRRIHRKLDENGQAQFSGAVFAAADIETFDDYVLKLASDEKDELLQELEQHATELEAKLINMQYSGPVEYNGYVYLSLFHLIQFWYSSNYDGFSALVKHELKKVNNNLLSDYLDSTERPLLSTGDIPYHALRYAYGAKVYEGHEHQRLDPAWHNDGTVERPYSGKVYVSLHPIQDYTEHKPTHITSQFKHGLINLSNIISAERETSFLGYLPEDRVVMQHLAKYPSFHGEYKDIYQSKYGLDPAMYNKVQETLENNPPHSPERVRVIKILEEYFCAYQEVRLIAEATKKASERGEVLIYRNEDGGFSLEPSDTPSTRVKRLHDFIMDKREQYTGESTLKMITPLSNAQRKELIPDKVKYPIDAECTEILTPKKKK